MSSGPIKSWRNAWKPVQLSARGSGRVHFKKFMEVRSICGRRPGESVADWAQVNCADCFAARAADSEPTQ